MGYITQLKKKTKEETSKDLTNNGPVPYNQMTDCDLHQISRGSEESMAPYPMNLNIIMMGPFQT